MRIHLNAALMYGLNNMGKHSMAGSISFTVYPKGWIGKQTKNHQNCALLVEIVANHGV